MQEDKPANERSGFFTRRRLTKLFAGGAVGLVVVLVATEMYLRFVLGMCDIPLYSNDPSIEYILQPSQECRVFGNRLHYNKYSMRSDDFPATKSSPEEIRIIVAGDSVVNGGVNIDQTELVTEQLKSKLSEATGRPVVVGNLSCTSWGPPNHLAYVETFGIVDADLFVLVMTSGDHSDVPTFEKRAGLPAWPEKRPLLATWNAAQRAFDRFLARRDDIRPRLRDRDHTPPQKDIDAALNALRDLIRLVRAQGAEMVIAQHLMEREIDGPQGPGLELIRNVAEEMNVPLAQLGPAFDEARKRGIDPYRDWVHPNAEGYQVMAEALIDPILHVLGPVSAPSAPPADAGDHSAEGS